jgi:membrane protein
MDQKLSVMTFTGFFKEVWHLLTTTFSGFSNDRAMKLSASLAYYTIFSLAPLLIMLISLTSLIYGKAAVEGEVFNGINEFVGNDAARQIQDIIQKVSVSENSVLAVIIGTATLFLGATGVFLEIQDSINMIWRVRAKPKKGWQKLIINRFISFSMIISLGFLLVVSLIINGLVLALSNKLDDYFPDVTILLVNLLNVAITFLVISTLFAIIFKFLPDVEISWKDVRMGAIATALLFMLGRYLIGLYIEKVAPGSAYGAAGSLVIILVWIYYSAAILYFGAEFTKVYAERYGRSIHPSPYAVYVIQTEEEKEVDVLPPQHNDIP